MSLIVVSGVSSINNFIMPEKFGRSAVTYYNTNYEYTFVQNKNGDGRKMHGSRRVIMFCVLTTVLPSILIVLPLYLRNIKYADVLYKISDSDVIQIHKGQSSVFCEKHSLKMNATFNAFQMKGTPVISEKKKHISLKKSMVLPDDTLEYWGFYLFNGATVELKACSRYIGSKILVVKGEKELNTCGILEGNRSKKDPQLAENQGQVLVTLESPDKRNNRKYRKEHNNGASENVNDKEDKALLETRNIMQDIINKHSRFNNSDFKQTKSYGFNQIHDLVNGGKQKRDIKHIHNPNTVLDAGVNHGGNAFNVTDTDLDASVSSFENSLHECYDGNILINEFFPYSINCNSSNYLEKTTTLKVTHEVLLDGYYYYIFYSDNDIVQNYIHVIFDIYKPTFQYTNMSKSKVCINQTECDFNVDFFSDELVIVEVPTRVGIRSEDNDHASLLISICHPRMPVYVFFPVSVLVLILLFAFL